LNYTSFKEKHDLNNTFKSLGLVFGDIGTSPIYTLTVIFLLLESTTDNILGILSLIIWTLTLIVTCKYVWLAMSLSKRGEGGTIVLMEILHPLLKSTRAIGFVSILAYVGACLLIGDGIITPAISILSAVEGIRFIPGFGEVSQMVLVVAAALIAFTLIMYQKRGTDNVAKTFAPVMFIWFISLLLSGFVYFIQAPGVIKVLNPYYALDFLYRNGFIAFFSLSEVILCATGGEALYADMGQLKRKPITQAWCFVFICLLFNYLGQAVYMIQHPEARNILFGMVFHQTKILYIPFLILSVFATIIASQAMITGIFSIVYQAINTRLMPMFKVEYTSDKVKEQIYISVVNWFLLIAVIFIMFLFQTSDKLAAAYGLAVTGAMTFAGIMMVMIFYLRRQYFRFVCTIIVTTVISIFLASTLLKIPSGGYWSLILTCIPLSLIFIYTLGQKRLFRRMKPYNSEKFLNNYNKAYSELNKLNGTALFLVRDYKIIPRFVANTMFKNGIIYEDNVFISIIRKSGSWGVHSRFRKDLAPGLRVFEIRIGYMEKEFIHDLIVKAGINEKVIFYGVEDILTKNIFWKIFAMIKKLTPPYVQFFKFPYGKLHGVVTRIEM